MPNGIHTIHQTGAPPDPARRLNNLFDYESNNNLLPIATMWPLAMTPAATDTCTDIRGYAVADLIQSSSLMPIKPVRRPDNLASWY